jgi:hypothetical protein
VYDLVYVDELPLETAFLPLVYYPSDMAAAGNATNKSRVSEAKIAAASRGNQQILI